MNELKKCPFCGGEARLADEPIGKGKCLYSVLCENDCVVQGTYHTTAESAIKAWNRRKPIERVIERLEETKGTIFDEEGKVLTQEDYFIDIDDAIKIIKEGLE